VKSDGRKARIQHFKNREECLKSRKDTFCKSKGEQSRNTKAVSNSSNPAELHGLAVNPLAQLGPAGTYSEALPHQLDPNLSPPANPASCALWLLDYTKALCKVSDASKIHEKKRYGIR